MDDVSVDSGLTTTQLWRIAWVLGLIAVGAFVRLGQYAADDHRVRPVHLVWLAVCIFTTVFSACCSLLVGLKSAEVRLARQAPGRQA